MIGGDHTIRELRVATISQQTGPPVFPSYHSVKERISFPSAFALLAKAAIATDAFTMVHSFNSGIVTALIVGLLVMLLTEASFYVFIRSWAFDEAYSYEDLWRMLFGRGLAWIPIFLLLISYVMCVVAGYWEMSQCAPDLLANVWPDAPAILTNIWFLHYFFGAIVMLPFLFSVRLADFRWLGWLSLFGLLVAVGCLLVHFISQTAMGSISSSSDKIVYFSGDFSLIAEVFEMLSCAFFAHPFVAPISRQMLRPTRDRILKLTWFVNILCGIVSYGVPLIGFLFFTDIEAEENIYLYLDGQAPEVIMGKISMLVLSIASTMYYTFFIAQVIVQAITAGPVRSDKIPLFVTGLAVTLTSICINLTDETWTLALYAIGSIAFNIIGFVLPEVYYLKQFGFISRQWGIISAVVLIFGLGMVAISIYSCAAEFLGMAQ
jgi:hypothetical protein